MNPRDPNQNVKKASSMAWPEQDAEKAKKKEEEEKKAAKVKSVAEMRNKPRDAQSKEERRVAKEAKKKLFAEKEEPLLYH